MRKIINEDVLNSMVRGITSVGEVVSTTLGPYGKNVAILNTTNRMNMPLLTDDGVRVIEYALQTLEGVDLLGAKLFYESSKKTEKDVGDGTTSTYILAKLLVDYYMSNIDGKSDIDPIRLRYALNSVAKSLTSRLSEYTKSVKSYEDIHSVALVSSGREDIAEIVANIRTLSGKDGLINIKTGTGTTDRVEMKRGYEFQGGLPHKQAFSVSDNIDIPNPLVVVTQSPLRTYDDIAPIMSWYTTLVTTQATNRPLVIFTTKCEGDALDIIVNNMYNRPDGLSLQVFPIEVPMSGDISGVLEDIAQVCGVKQLSTLNQSVELVKKYFSEIPDHTVESVVTGKVMTYVVSSNNPESVERINSRVNQLQSERDDLKGEDTLAKDAELAVRISKLNGLAVTVYVGAPTVLEINERRMKYEDAILATASAIEYGAVVGMGLTYSDLANLNNSYKDKYLDLASQMLNYGLLKLAKLVPTNCGIDVDSTWDKVLKGTHSYDLSTGELVEGGVTALDPVKVIESVIINAVSAVSMLLSTSSVVLVELHNKGE